MPLVCRPFSVNTYCISKIWFKTGSVDLRVSDGTAISSKLKSYVYQDLLQKPSEVMLYRRVEEGGLGLHHVQSKALAHLISTFIQTAANKRFRRSLFHSWLYRFHIEGEDNLPNPGFTPYYDRNFFEVIKEAHTQPQLNPPEMTVSQWYQFLLSRNLTKQVINEVPVLVPCRIEEKYPQICWADSYRISRLKGLSPQNKSFLFKLIHELLPSKERLNHLNLAPTSLCWCSN